ncbi:MAG: T9SS type A sorting domain-containing protein, partial [Bacteroidales bacterium]|nr:T9SS type A sorting domain-containing protein [Bacteroidales bacterium]
MKMKKLFLFLVIAGLLGAGAIQAQKSIPVKGRVDVQRIQERFFENAASAGLLNVKGINEAKGAKAISPDLIDTIGPTAYHSPSYTARSAGAGNYIYRYPGGENVEPSDIVWYNMLSGQLVPWWFNGSEIGQKFSVSPEQGQEDGPYWDIIGVNLKEYMVVGAVSLYARWKSKAFSTWGYDDNNIPSMPLRMKLYAFDNVEQQQFFRQIVQPMINEDPVATSARRNQLQKVTSTYPRSSKRYSAISDTLYAEFRNLPPEDPNYVSPYIYYGRIGGLFDRSMSAGSDFCITVELPLGYKSTNRLDTVWNFSLNVPLAGTAGNYNEIDEYDINGMIVSYNTKSSYFIEDVDTTIGKAWLLPAGNPQIVTDPDDGMVFFPASTFSWFSEDMAQRTFGSDAELDAAADLFRPATMTSVLIFPLIAEGLASEKINPSLLRVSVSPVPAIDKVNIVCVDNMERVEILNIAGKVLKRVAVNDNIASVSVTDLPSGMYL